MGQFLSVLGHVRGQIQNIKNVLQSDVLILYVDSCFNHSLQLEIPLCAISGSNSPSHLFSRCNLHQSESLSESYCFQSAM